MLQICQVIANINETVGGPAFSVTSLASALTQKGCDSHLFTLNYPEHGPQVAAPGVTIHSYTSNLITRFFRGLHPQAGQALTRLAAQFDIIHNHGLWMVPNIYARVSALKNHRPLICSPRGMLEDWSLQYSKLKKSLAWVAYERANLTNATAFHATSESELEAIRKLGFQQPVALIPNGVDLPAMQHLPERKVLEHEFAELKDKRWVLFLSRIHPKKGLDNLLHVWQKLAVRYSDWHLIIAGSDLIGYQSSLETLTKELNLSSRVTFTGMLSGQRKESAFANAELFVLPTHSENFGIAIAEALAWKLPVITTVKAPWQELQAHQCGWWIEDSQAALNTVFNEALALSRAERLAMGDRGRALVAAKYSWGFFAGQMADVYRWILGGGALPDCVHQFNGQFNGQSKDKSRGVL